MRSTVQVRLDEETRVQASELFERIGLDIPTAIRMFLKQSIVSNGLPFQPMSVKDITKTQLEADGWNFRELVEHVTGEQIQARQALKQVFQQMQEESVKNGTDSMTMEEIDAEIAAYRREKRGEK